MSLSLEEQLRINLAASLRIVAHLGMHEAVANHFSAAVSDDGKQFLMNPKWKHFSRVCASDMLLLDADDASNAERPEVDATRLVDPWPAAPAFAPCPCCDASAPGVHHRYRDDEEPAHSCD
ncbi:class II aldolase/adducin family protein [Oceanobacter sp. 4_MG-2023]|uniref:class II aldolase/adducin family protein n=1 Tax=Oceanobacter sp. 4_MG-2023 TaxID=3062623 RepID=UPI0027368574|nr:class II aldolase/adducin family protein [Oceanobacter sp. 4_MG-2023]MDP2547574.1 class II aldolase/adducin family protein [Oceanobacter sp. 4_MG-2023]